MLLVTDVIAVSEPPDLGADLRTLLNKLLAKSLLLTPTKLPDVSPRQQLGEMVDTCRIALTLSMDPNGRARKAQ